jgi:hypothetical protein
MIKKAIVIILLVFNAPMAFATTCFFTKTYNYYPNGIDSIVGTIKGFSRNTIDFYDEDKKIDRRFIYLVNQGKFNAGDRVRLYYYPVTNTVQNLKRMTVVEYRKIGQNEGYILKREK